MANSKYEYVKSFEAEDEIMPPNLIVVRVDGREFGKFSELHNFKKPNDERALSLMNACAVTVLEEFPDIVFSYGFSDEFSFVFKKTTRFYQRRASKILSLIASSFTSVYVKKWEDYFPQVELKHPPSFHGHIVCCATMEVLQSFLAWRQDNCHTSHLYDSCFWSLIQSGKSETEAHEILKGTQKQEKNELLFREFDVNYKNLPAIFRQGSFVFKTQVEDIVKYRENGEPIKRLRRRAAVVHSENIAGRTFWNGQPILCKELGCFEDDICHVKPDYVRFFQFEPKLLPSTYIVIRLDGCHFHRFSEVHDFEKPNDKQALDLMNLCAVAVLKEFPEVIFSYGVSDEYSFILKKDSQFYQRRASNIISVVVSLFTSVYAMNWKKFFPRKELKHPPLFDGRTVCYPSDEILHDYLAWRQVDCHINNQYNTCFWMLVKSGKSKKEAQAYLKGTQAREKNELLIHQFGIDYNTLPVMFRNGSSVFQKKGGDTVFENGIATSQSPEIVVEHCNIIEQSFWEKNPDILDEHKSYVNVSMNGVNGSSQNGRM